MSFRECSGTTFTKSNLENANFGSVSESSFSDSTLGAASFRNAEACDFRRSDFRSSREPSNGLGPRFGQVLDSDFSDALMNGVLFSAFGYWVKNAWRKPIEPPAEVLKGLYEKQKTLVTNCSFVGASLANSSVIGTEFVDCDFRNADLSGADLSFTRFVNCNFQGTRHSGAVFFEASFEDCIEALDFVPTDPRWKRSAPRWYEELEIQELNAKSAREGKPEVQPVSLKSAVSSPQPELEARKKRSRRKKESISKALRYEVLNRDGFRCLACGRSANTHPDVVLHVDHIKPESKGGATDQANLQTLCMDCNLGKGNRDDTDLRR